MQENRLGALRALEHKLAILFLLAPVFGDPTSWPDELLTEDALNVRKRELALVGLPGDVLRGLEGTYRVAKKLLTADLVVTQMLKNAGVLLDEGTKNFIMGILSPFANVREQALSIYTALMPNTK